MLKRITLGCALALVLALPLGLTGCGGDDIASVVKKECSSCHTMDRTWGSSATTESEWEDIIVRMESYGYKAPTGEDRQAMLDYLVEESSKDSEG